MTQNCIRAHGRMIRLGSRIRMTNSKFYSEIPSLRTPPRKDPMAHMTEAEKEQHRREIRVLSRKTFQIAYGIIGGAMGLVVYYTTIIIHHQGISSMAK